jgi:hypothetical protein
VRRKLLEERLVAQCSKQDTVCGGVKALVPEEWEYSERSLADSRAMLVKVACTQTSRRWCSST